jgi:ABC-type transport system substrate-binding protein
MKKQCFVAVLTVCILSITSIYGTNEVTASYTIPSNLNTGPYVDAIDFKVISSQTQRILALQSGTIDLDTSFFDPVHYDTLNADPDIAVFSAMRNGYGHITINCRDWPLNETVLRQAFAYAYNKTRVTSEIMHGWSLEHDSIVPFPNSWCIEDELSPHYYTAQVSVGNQILDDSGDFDVNQSTGYREYRGQPFDIRIEYSSSSVDIGGGIAQIGVDALTALHVNAHTQVADFNEYISRLDSHDDYDMIFYTQEFYGNDVDWLAYEYWSDYANIPFQNPTNFRNSTYDACRAQLLNSTNYNDIYNASSWMQRILQEQVPRLVVYENTYSQAYRTDKFTGHVADLGRYITGPWTMRKIHKLDGSLGGTVSVAIANQPDSFNIFVANTAASASILSNLYSSLYKYGPDLQPWPDLAESMLVETHDDNSAVPAGHTRYTINIIQNATWNDGIPLSAQDIVFTFEYLLGSYTYGNPAATDLGDLVTVESPAPYTVVLEFDRESFWLFSSFAYEYILPCHVYNGTSFSSWTSAFYPYVTSGPFYLESYETGEWYRITKNWLYYYQPPNPAPVVSRAEDLTYVEGTTGNVIVWEVSDDNPLLYAIYQDDNLTSLVMDIWNGDEITLNVDGLSVGTYNYTLFVFDYSANFAVSSILVTVVPAGTTTTTTSGGTGLEINTMTFLIAAGAFGIIVLVALVVWRSKQSIPNPG